MPHLQFGVNPASERDNPESSIKCQTINIDQVEAIFARRYCRQAGLLFFFSRLQWQSPGNKL